MKHLRAYFEQAGPNGGWWGSLSPDQQQTYLKAHPKSRLKPSRFMQKINPESQEKLKGLLKKGAVGTAAAGLTGFAVADFAKFVKNHPNATVQEFHNDLQRKGGWDKVIERAKTSVKSDMAGQEPTVRDPSTLTLDPVSSYAMSHLKRLGYIDPVHGDKKLDTLFDPDTAAALKELPHLQEMGYINEELWWNNGVERRDTDDVSRKLMTEINDHLAKKGLPELGFKKYQEFIKAPVAQENQLRVPHQVLKNALANHGKTSAELQETLRNSVVKYQQDNAHRQYDLADHEDFTANVLDKTKQHLQNLFAREKGVNVDVNMSNPAGSRVDAIPQALPDLLHQWWNSHF